MKEQAQPVYSFLRFFRKLMLIIARNPLIPSTQRWRFLKWGGVNIQGPCFIGDDIWIDSLRPDLITIGEGCVITAGVRILSHFVNDDSMYYGEVKIGRRVFVGLNSLIVNAVTIGDGALIGAGSIVTKDIPEKEVWAGSPAKYLKKREINI